MGILTQALGGALSGAGTTGAQVMNEQFLANLQAQRDAAQSLREENLARLKNSWSPSTSYDPDTGRQLTNEEASQYEPDSLIGARTAEQNFTVNPNYTINGRPATNQQIQDNAAANENMGLIQTAQQNRRQEAINAPGGDVQGSEGPQTSLDKVNAVKSASDMTPEEQDIAESWKGDAGTLGNTKEAMLESKMTNQKELSDAKMAMTEKLATIRAQAIKDAADLKYQTAVQIANMKIASGNADETRQARLELQRAESQRKASEAAAKLIQTSQGIDNMDNETRKQYNRLVQLSGGGDDIAPMLNVSKEDAKKQATKEAEDKTHWYKPDSSSLGTDKKSWIDNRTKEIQSGGSSGLIGTAGAKPATPSRSKSMDYNSLPPGSTPVPGKFTTDGRPVFKTPAGQLVSPKAH